MFWKEILYFSLYTNIKCTEFEASFTDTHKNFVNSLTWPKFTN